MMFGKFFRKEACVQLDSRKFTWDWNATRYNRIALVNMLCSDKLDGHYLEIGCQGNICFDAIPVVNKIGVDPETGGTHRALSDDFFRENKQDFDVIFIDGLHIYDQVRRDVINAIRCIKPNGWVALHDMLPLDATSEHVPNISEGAWCGDVWKVAFELANTKGIDFRIVTIDSGIGVFRVLDTAIALADMTSELSDKRFGYLYEHINELPIVNWFEACRWIRSGL